MATSDDAVAIGTGATASDGAAVAIGLGNQASGDGAVAIGDPNIATGQGAIAIGKDNVATGNAAIAFGDTSTANGVSAIAAGLRANAAADNAIALGNSASALGANGVAIGNGAQSVRDDQVAIGSAASSYTLAGINSDASRAAQQGALRLVTADGAGNLGTTSFDLDRLNALPGQVSALSSQISAFDARLAQFGAGLERIERSANGGIAAAMAMGGTVIPSDMTVALSFNLSTFRGEQGFSGVAVGRISERVWVSGGIAGSTVKGSTGGRIGMTFGW